MKRGRLFIAVLIFACAMPVLALAKPNVAVHLDGALVQKNAKGQETSSPIGSITLHRGQTVRYTIDARNSGTDAALDFSTSGKVPAQTQFVAGSVTAPQGTIVEYTLDGKSWSAHPTVTVKTPHGMVHKPANPASYAAVRFTSKRPLAANATFSYSYEVQVK